METSDIKQKAKEIRFKVPQDKNIVNYTNIAIVSHSSEEFLVDFGQILPSQNNESLVVSRMVMTPRNAKKLWTVLGQNVRTYEEHFGEIKIFQGPPQPNQKEEIQ